MGDIRLFVSHTHEKPDSEIAVKLVNLIEAAMVRDGRILCTSHPDKQQYGYTEPGKDLSEHLREHLSEAACVLAVLTPHSRNRPWCLFELGGAWARATETLPLLAGGLTEKDLLGPLSGKPCGQLGDPQDLRCLLKVLHAVLKWKGPNIEAATRQIDELVALVRGASWASPPVQPG